MDCSYFDAGRCGSCTLMGQPYPEQVRAKDELAHRLLGDVPGLTWDEPFVAGESGFRNRAKMVVGGSAKKPTLGILDDQGYGVDLRRCGVIDPAITAILPLIASFIRVTRLSPYNVPARRGELKHVLVTANPRGELMLRFVVRSHEAVELIRRNLDGLLQRLPQLVLVTANLLPKHVAALEGAEEIHLAGAQTLAMPVGPVTLRLRPQGFFQTNTAVAAELYAQAAAWIDDAAPRSVWDLYCGVGGFALHAAAPGREVTGIEISPGAIEGARTAAEQARADGIAGIDGVRFEVGDATAFAIQAEHAAELVLVNPPRRGIGSELAAWLEHSDARHVIYSSCNPHTLASDLRAMPSWRPVRARVMDMFPQTEHFEVITALTRR